MGETLADSDESAMARLDRAWAADKLSWVSRPYWRDGYFGRGFVQLTHEYNYVKAGQKLALDLAGDPGLALDAQIAAEILVRGMLEGWFTGKKLIDYITLKRSDYVGARRVVNGTDKAHAIAELARDYEAALLAEGYGVEKAAPVVNTRRDGKEPRTSSAQSTTIWATLTALLASLGQISEQAKGVVGQVSESLGVSPEFAIFLIVGAALAWVFKERLRKWAGGDR